MRVQHSHFQIFTPSPRVFSLFARERRVPAWKGTNPLRRYFSVIIAGHILGESIHSRGLDVKNLLPNFDGRGESLATVPQTMTFSSPPQVPNLHETLRWVSYKSFQIDNQSENIPSIPLNLQIHPNFCRSNLGVPLIPRTSIRGDAINNRAIEPSSPLKQPTGRRLHFHPNQFTIHMSTELWIGSRPCDYRRRFPFYPSGQKYGFPLAGHKSQVFNIHLASVIIPEKNYRNLVQERLDLKNRLEKLKMDVATFQKNAALQQAKAKTRIQNQLMKNLVPVVRQLEMARSFDLPQVHSKKQATFLRNLNQNLILVYETFLGSTSLTEIAPNVGDAFNETTESAQGLMYAPNQPPNSVLRAVWKGYMFGGEVLQRAEVILSTDNPDHPNILQPDARQESGEKMGWRARLRKIFTNNPNSKV